MQITTPIALIFVSATDKSLNFIPGKPYYCCPPLNLRGGGGTFGVSFVKMSTGELHTLTGTHTSVNVD